MGQMDYSPRFFIYPVSIIITLRIIPAIMIVTKTGRAQLNTLCPTIIPPDIEAHPTASRGAMIG